MSPSSRASLTPVTVTVCATFQLTVVKVRLDGLTVPSVVSSELRPIVTSAVGCVRSLTAKVVVPPAFGRDPPWIGVTMMPAVSPSALVTATSMGSTPVVGGVGAGRRRVDDVVGDVAVVDGVVDAGDGDGLRNIPVGGREREARRR